MGERDVWVHYLTGCAEIIPPGIAKSNDFGWLCWLGLRRFRLHHLRPDAPYEQSKAGFALAPTTPMNYFLRLWFPKIHPENLALTFDDSQ